METFLLIEVSYSTENPRVSRSLHLWSSLHLFHLQLEYSGRGVHCRISDRIRKFLIGEIATWIRSEIFGYPNFSDRITGFSDRITGFSDRITGFSDRVRIRSENPKFFPDTRSEISEILKSDRISEISDRIGGFSDRVGGFSDRIFRIGYFCTPLSSGNHCFVLQLSPNYLHSWIELQKVDIAIEI